jgi:hypothetical protein
MPWDGQSNYAARTLRPTLSSSASALREPDAVIDAVRAYLGSWSTERVERLQRADAGWAPFDQFQQPLTMTTPDDVDDFHRDLHRHCSALRASGHELPPELHELDLFLLLAHALLQVTRTDGAQRRLHSVS